jgi:hypothetical protein
MSASDLEDVFAFLAVATKLEGKNRIEAATKVRESHGATSVLSRQTDTYRYPNFALVAVL